jgi:hypothetical protein
MLATNSNLITALDVPRHLWRGNIRKAARESAVRLLTAMLGRRIARNLSPEIISLEVEPPADRLVDAARRYTGMHTNYLILSAIAKMVDFLRRGAAGVISVVGINCMVGTAASAAIPAIRADFRQVPITTLFYGGAEGPSQRIRIETFVHQVRQFAESTASAPNTAS